MFIDPTTVVDIPVFSIKMLLHFPGNFIPAAVDIVIGRCTVDIRGEIRITYYERFSTNFVSAKIERVARRKNSGEIRIFWLKG